MILDLRDMSEPLGPEVVAPTDRYWAHGLAGFLDVRELIAALGLDRGGELLLETLDAYSRGLARYPRLRARILAEVQRVRRAQDGRGTAQ